MARSGATARRPAESAPAGGRRPSVFVLCSPRAWPSAAAEATPAHPRQPARPVRRPEARRLADPAPATRTARLMRRSRRAGRCRAATCRTPGTSPAPITSANVSKLGVAWCVPIESTGEAQTVGVTDGYSTTPVVVNGVVYLQDMESNVMAIRLATGKVLWTHNYSSPNGGPDGVNVVNGVVYAATNHAAVALSAATGRQLWSRTADRQRPRGHRHDARVQRRHRVRVDRAGQPDRGPVSRRRQGDLVGAERRAPARRNGRGTRCRTCGETRASTPAAACGIRRRSTATATSTSASRTPARSARAGGPAAIRGGPAGRARTCTPTRWSS